MLILTFIKELENSGIEIIINNIDLDGTMNGYDIDLIRSVIKMSRFLLVLLGEQDHIKK